MASFSAITTWLTTKFFLGKKISRLVEDNDSRMDEIKSRHTVDDLKLVQEYADWWIKHQRSDGKVEFLDKEMKDVDRLFLFQTLSKKHSDWFSTEPEGVPEEKRMEHIRSEIADSINLIIEHGYKRALKIRKESQKTLEQELTK